MPGRVGSHRGSHSPLLLCSITEPNDVGSRLGIKGSACEVVGGACLQQNHRAAINPCVLWRNWREEGNKISSRCSQQCSLPWRCPSICPSQQISAALAQFTTTTYSASEEASLDPPAFSACWLLFHSCCYCLILYTPLLPKGVCFRWRQISDFEYRPHPGEGKVFPSQNRF